MAHEHARKDEADTDKPWALGYVPRRRTADGRAAGKKEGWMFRDGSRVTAQRKGHGSLGVGKVPPNVLEVSQKENSNVGRDPGALSVSHSKFSFPTSVSTVPLLYSPVLAPLLPRSFSRPPLSSVSWTSLGSRARIELWCRCSQDGVSCSKPFLGRESERGREWTRARARHGSQHGAMESGPVRANLADQTGAKSRAFVRVNSIHELSIFLISSSLRHFPSGAIPDYIPPLVPSPAGVLLPRHPRPFQSMSSRQRAFRYF